MVPWVRDDTFLEGKDWREGVRRYENFLKKYLMNGTDKNVVLLELGVGEMTPVLRSLSTRRKLRKNMVKQQIQGYLFNKSTKYGERRCA